MPTKATTESLSSIPKRYFKEAMYSVYTFSEQFASSSKRI